MHCLGLWKAMELPPLHWSSGWITCCYTGKVFFITYINMFVVHLWCTLGFKSTCWSQIDRNYLNFNFYMHFMWKLLRYLFFQAPPNSGSHNYNYKNSHSIILMAVVDANMRFLLVDTGTPGRQSDSGIK